MEASRIAKKQMSGGAMSHMMNHESPAPLRNHARQNILAIREKERQLRGKRVMESLKVPDAPFKLKQFDNAKSRVGDTGRRPSASPSPSSGAAAAEGPRQDRPMLSADALAQLEKSDPLAALAAGAGRRAASMPNRARPPRPTPEVGLSETAKKTVSFSTSCISGAAPVGPVGRASPELTVEAVLKEEAAAAAAATLDLNIGVPDSPGPAAPPSSRRLEPAAGADEDVMDLAAFEAACDDLKRKYGGKNNSPEAKKSFKRDAKGRPAYLNRIKGQLAEEQRMIEEARKPPEVPPGYRVLPHEEREETLGALKEKRAELEKEYRRLPLHIQTDAQKRREKMVLDKIKESDDAISVFSQQRVLVEA